MGEHSEKGRQARAEDAPTQALPPVPGTPAREEMYRDEPPPVSSPPRAGWRETRARVGVILTTVSRWVGLIFALILALHVILTVGAANPDNGITSTIRGWAEPLSLGFHDLFTNIGDMKAEVLVNYGIAALFWLVVSSVVARIFRGLGGVGGAS